MPQRLPRPSRGARAGVVALKASAGVVALSVAFGLGPGVAVGSHDEAPSIAAPADTTSGPVERLLDRHDCSVTGFDEGTQPVSAVVRSAGGALRFVDFDTGWRVYTRHGRATLVAVCLGEPPTH